jgi:hypothetical protein
MFDIANLSLGIVILLLRVAVVFLLYFFLWQVLRVIGQDLRAGPAPSPAQINPYGQLIVMSAGQTGLPVGKIFPLSPTTIIGRTPDSDVALNDNFLSGNHAQMRLQDDEWILEDMHSTNGTFINGFEVRTPTSINDGDIIRVGRVELKLVR